MCQDDGEEITTTLDFNAFVGSHGVMYGFIIKAGFRSLTQPTRATRYGLITSHCLKKNK